jgi:hypothetical protein
MKTEKITTKVFRLGGLAIGSELPLPGLPEVEARSIDVSIRIGEAPSMLSDAIEIEAGCLANADEYLHTVPGVAVFYLRGGCDIIVQPLDFSRLGEIRSFLHSVIFAVMFFRRGLLPLHASAVKVQGRVFAFMGMSGAGKSSLAAYLGRRGYQVIADDLTLLNRTKNGITKVTPCAPWLKLWQDALDGFGMPREGLNPVAGKHTKYLLPLADAASDVDQSLPLGGLFVLETGTADAVELLPLAGAAAVTALMDYTYPRPLVHKLRGDAELFKRCGDVLGTVPVSTFRRPWDLASFDPSVDRLLAAIFTTPLKTAG